jgi:hypothetical protein
LRQATSWLGSTAETVVTQWKQYGGIEYGGLPVKFAVFMLKGFQSFNIDAPITEARP